MDNFIMANFLIELMKVHRETERLIECVGGPLDGGKLPFILGKSKGIVKIGLKTTYVLDCNKFKFFWRWIGVAHQGEEA